MNQRQKKKRRIASLLKSLARFDSSKTLRRYDATREAAVFALERRWKRGAIKPLELDQKFVNALSRSRLLLIQAYAKKTGRLRKRKYAAKPKRNPVITINSGRGTFCNDVEINIFDATLTQQNL